MIGTITRLELAPGCHKLTVVDEEGKEHYGCTGDAYPLILITYTGGVDDIFGKQIEFTLNEQELIRETRSIEGYSAEQILEAMENRTRFLDPVTGTIPGVTHHIIRKHNERIRRKADKRTNLLTYVPALGKGPAYHFVVEHGLFETATLVWLGAWPCSLPMPETDADTITTVAHLRNLGGIARAGIVPPKGPEVPALVCSR
jgi:hypothetical protein